MVLSRGWNAIIVSDLHIGLPYFRRQEFLDLVGPLDADTTLVLNGDTLDNPSKRLSPQDQDVLNFIRDQSYKGSKPGSYEKCKQTAREVAQFQITGS